MEMTNGKADPDLAVTILNCFREEYWHQSFCDFVVMVDGHEFKCHRFILSACSGFFNGLLRSGMRECLEGNATIHGISKQTFSTLLSCFYTGSNIFSKDNMIELWHGINLLQIDCLKKACENFIKRNVGDNYSEIYKYAKAFDCKSVTEKCLKQMAEEFESFWKTDAFLDIFPEDLEKLLKREDLRVTSEDDVIYAILRWVSQAPDSIEYSEAGTDIFTDRDQVNSDAGEETRNYVLSTQDKQTPEKMDNSIEAVFSEGIKLGASARSEGDIGQSGAQVPEMGTGRSDTLSQRLCTASSVEEENFGQQWSTDHGEKADEEESEELVVMDSIEHLRNNKLPIPITDHKAYLGPLLSQSRICVVSTECIEVLMNNPMILECKEALLVVREAVLFQLKPQHALTYWPPSSIHRQHSKLENVVVYVEERHNALIKAYSLSRKEFLYLSRTPSNGDEGVALPRLTTFNGSVLLAKVTRLYNISKSTVATVMETISMLKSCNNWTSVTLKRNGVSFLLPHDGHLYLIGQSVYRIGLKNFQFCGESGELEELCTFTSCEIEAAAGLGKNILLFSSNGSSLTTTVFNFNTDSFTYSELPSLEGQAAGLISFPDAGHTYILQRDGSLWCIESDPTIHFRFVAKLWDFKWKIDGAVVYGQDLFLFGESMAEGSFPCQTQWLESLEGIFNKIHVVYVNAKSQCVPLTVKKDLLISPTSISMRIFWH